MLGILLFLFPRLRTKLVLAQGLRYKAIIRQTVNGLLQLQASHPSSTGGKATALYTHSMSGSCQKTRLIVLVRLITPPKGTNGHTEKQQAAQVPPARN